MRLLLSYTMLCVSLCCLSQAKQKYVWNASNTLSWGDFKAQPDTTSIAAALTASGISFKFSIKYNNKQVSGFTTEVLANFYPNQSWYKSQSVSPHILAHEQLHFDLAELYARVFREALSKLQPHQNIKAQLNTMQIHINKTLDATQKQYDTETQHSINKDAQLAWQIHVKKQLEDLNAYQ